jgi:hypothetical protein
VSEIAAVMRLANHAAEGVKRCEVRAVIGWCTEVVAAVIPLSYRDPLCPLCQRAKVGGWHNWHNATVFGSLFTPVAVVYVEGVATQRRCEKSLIK